MRAILVYLLYIPALMILILSGCENLDCPGGNIDISISGDLIIQGQERASKTLSLEYPRNCKSEPYNGYFTVEILNSNEIPGLHLSLVEFSPSEFWFGYDTPPSGKTDIQLYAFPREEDGLPAAPQPGTYEIRIQASFDDPQQSDVETLTVQVLSDGFNLIIQEPNDDSRYFAGDNSIQLKALARDQEHGIASLDYRLDSGQWVTNTFDNELQVEYETQIAVPTPEAYTLYVRAINGAGDERVESQEFFIPIDPNFLTDHEWDGGGDNLNWGDPLNWVDDRLPGLNDRSIIRNNVPEEVRIGNDQPSFTVYTVGAFDIRTDAVLSGNTVLEVVTDEQKSRFGRVRFEVLNGDERPIIRFGVGCDHAEIEFTNVFNMTEMSFESYSENEVIVHRGIIPEGSNNGFSQAFVKGAVNFRFTGIIDFQEPVFWEIESLGTDPVGPTFNVSGTWGMRNGSTFTVNGDAATRFSSTGNIVIQHTRREVENVLIFSGDIHFDIRGSWSNFNYNFPSPGSATIFQTTSEETNFFNRFGTNNRLVFEGGNWAFENPESVGVSKMTLSDQAEIDIAGGFFETDSIIVDQSSRLNLGTHFAANVLTLESGTLEMDEDCEIGKLVIQDGFFRFGTTRDTNTVKINRMEWYGGQDRSPNGARSTLEILEWQSPDYVREAWGRLIIDPSDAGTHNWNTHIKLSGRSTMEWNSGILFSNGNDVLYLDIDENSTVEIHADRNRLWGFNTLAGGQAQSFLRIGNAGTLNINGNGDVNIAGCLNLTGNGVLQETRSGQLNLIHSPGFCE